MYDLSALGFGPFFEQQLQSLNGRELTPARIAAEHRGAYGVVPDRLGSRAARRATSAAWVRVAGAVICRQRPGTAKGFLFLTLEDETGLVNVIVRPDVYERERQVLVSEAILEVEGVLQTDEGLAVRAQAVRPCFRTDPAPAPPPSRWSLR